MPEAFISEKNPLLKEVRKAAHRGGLTSGAGCDGYALAEGPHLLEEALRSGLDVHAVIVAESAREVVRGEVARSLAATGAARVMPVSNATFAGLATTEHSQGVLALVKPPTWTDAELLTGTAQSSRSPSGTVLLVVLDGIQDPGNAGAILRAAEAFGATGAVFLKGCVDPYNPKCLRGSAGSVFRLPLRASVAAEEFLAGCKLPLYAAEPRASLEIDRANLADPCALVIGSEGRGVSAAVAAKATGVRIPTAQVESLNAAVAAGILLYEARRQRGAVATARKGGRK